MMVAAASSGYRVGKGPGDKGKLRHVHKERGRSVKWLWLRRVKMETAAEIWQLIEEAVVRVEAFGGYERTTCRACVAV